jgi:hypothetical protein
MMVVRRLDRDFLVGAYLAAGTYTSLRHLYVFVEIINETQYLSAELLQLIRFSREWTPKGK